MSQQATSRAIQMKNNSRTTQVKKADARANRNTKAPMQLNNTAKLQEALWDAGFYKGMKDRRGRELTFEQAVDGVEGNMTKAAINKAKESGYFIKNDGSLGKYADIGPKIEYTPQTVGQRATKEELQRATKEAMSRGVSADIPTIKASSNGDGNTGASSTIYKRSGSRYPWDAAIIANVNNQYLYGYVDPEDYDNLTYGFVKKIGKGFTGSSELNDISMELAALDLKNPEQRKKAIELQKKLSNFKNSSIEATQQSIRSRIDLRDLYSGRSQTYNTFMENPDYKDPVAVAHGVPTYTFRDPALRRRQQQEALTYNKTKGKSGWNSVWGDVTSAFNRYSIAKDGDDGHGRFREDWDLVGYAPNRIFVADTIPANIGVLPQTIIGKPGNNAINILGEKIEF